MSTNNYNHLFCLNFKIYHSKYVSVIFWLQKWLTLYVIRTEIDRSQRGPYCFSCEAEVDAKTCSNVTVCKQDEVRHFNLFDINHEKW